MNKLWGISIGIFSLVYERGNKIIFTLFSLLDKSISFDQYFFVRTFFGMAVSSY